MDLGDISSKKLIWIKGWLFLFLGCFAAALLMLLCQSWRAAGLLAICVWGFCRFYYFTFYVIQHYVDPKHKFTGLLDFFRYAFRKKKPPE